MQAQEGDVVRVHYVGKLDDGTVFDSSRDREPIEFVIGGGEIIPAFEEAVVGMQEGEKKTILIPSDQAYGPRREELMLHVAREQFPPDLKPYVGQQLEMVQSNGQSLIVVVAEIDDDGVILDANHPLAGKDLTFEIELVEIARPAPRA
ncbi:MAG: peptidylprolyl isomerase [candidate division KSB1 bacterium]|nr:peptidylprolyl isomerase [candidate division KSB1 bacterium]